jgi:hypothetical protein
MWIVRLALRRPYTFVVMAMLIVMAGSTRSSRCRPTSCRRSTSRSSRSSGSTAACRRTRWSSASRQLRARPHHDGERHRAHREPVALRRLGHQGLLPSGDEDRDGQRPGDGDLQTLLKQFPVGATPPLIVNYSASNVPILQGSCTPTRCRSSSSSTSRATSSARASPPSRGRRCRGPTAASSGR